MWSAASIEGNPSGRQRSGGVLRSAAGREAHADRDLRVGDERVGRDRQVDRRRAAADPAGGVEDRAVAGAEPALVRALVAERHATQVGAVAVDDQPLVVAFLDAGLIALRIAKGREVDVARLLD